MALSPKPFLAYRREDFGLPLEKQIGITIPPNVLPRADRVIK